MSYQAIVNKNIQDGLVKRIADDILQGIEKVNEKKEIYSRRWVWELLQNAKDIPNQFNEVKIKITLKEDQLIFSHNGDPFSIQNLTNLIMQVSSKFEGEDDEVTGKFGTGFLVTHLLSKTLTVEGIVNENNQEPKRFSILMDREAENVKELIPKIESALKKVEFLDSDSSFKTETTYFKDRTENDYDTSFIYNLKDGRSLNWASKGIGDLINTLPLTLLFVNKVKEVLIDDQVNSSQISFNLRESISEQGEINTVKIKNENNPSEDKEMHFWLMSDDSYRMSCALQVKSPTDLTPVEWNKNTPKLYRDFPLIGSEKFHLPLVVNGHNFYPNEERKGLLIEDDENIKVQDNRLLLKKGVELIKQLIESMPSTVKDKLYLLALSKIPSEVPESWYKNEVQIPFREFLLESPIVASEFGLKKLKDSKFPKAGEKHETNELFYDVVAPFLGKESLPYRSELSNWLKTINSNYENWDCDLKYEVKDLVESIEGINLSEIELKDAMFTNVQWLNLLYQFLENQEMREDLNKYSIVPDRNGDLRGLEDLFINDGIHDAFLDAYKELGEDYSSKLIHSDVEIPFVGHQSMTNREIGDEINSELKDENFENREDRIEIIHSLLRIFPSDDDSSRKRFFRSFTEFYNLDPSPVVIRNISDDYNFDPVLKSSIENLLTDIQKFGNIESLCDHLEMNEDEALGWLNDLFQEVKDYLEDYTIIPTRLGHLDDLNCLFVNNGIHDVLLDVYKELGEDYSGSLIHDSILLPIVGHQSKSNKDIGEMINDEIKGDQFEHYSNNKELVVSLLRIFPSSESSFRKKIFEAFTTYNNYEKDELVIQGIQEHFNFVPILKRAIEILLSNISNDKSIGGLADYIGIEHDQSIIWLDRLLESINSSEEFKYLLDNYNVFPNQNETFIAKEDIYNDGIEDYPLPPELLSIHKEFSDEDLKEDLLLDGIGIRVEESKKIIELAGNIENYAKNVLNAMIANEAVEDEVSTLMSLVKWTTKNKALSEEHFKWTLEKKPMINTLRIEDPVIQDAIYDLIDGDNDKIIILSDIAKKLSTEQLEELSELTEGIEAESILELVKLNSSFTDSEMNKLSEIIDVIGTSSLLRIAEQAMEKEMDFQFKKKIGDKVESVFKEAFEIAASGLTIHKTEGKCDFYISNPDNDKKYYLELKSIGTSWKYIRMAQSQAEFSSENAENYALCVIRRPGNDQLISVDFIANNLKNLPQIGDLVRKAVLKGKEFKSDLIFGGIDGIGVEFSDSNFHYTVPESIWSEGKSFDELIETIKRRIS